VLKELAGPPKKSVSLGGWAADPAGAPPFCPAPSGATELPEVERHAAAVDRLDLAVDRVYRF
jgi:hypothetical protein